MLRSPLLQRIPPCRVTAAPGGSSPRLVRKLTTPNHHRGTFFFAESGSCVVEVISHMQYTFVSLSCEHEVTTARVSLQFTAMCLHRELCGKLSCVNGMCLVYWLAQLARKKIGYSRQWKQTHPLFLVSSNLTTLVAMC